MDFDTLALFAVGLTLVASLTLLLTLDWRWSVVALASQYIGVFLLVWLSWPLEMAVVKIVAGWMAAAALGTARASLPETATVQQLTPVNRPFRVVAACVVILVVVSVAPQTAEWVPSVRIEQVWGSLLLMGMGLLHLGLSTRPFRVILGLWTVLAGFEILYAAVESSTLVAGLLAGVNLGLAIVGSYLLAAPTWEDVR